MALDGLFLHYLISEIKDDVINKKIYKVTSINDTDYLLSLSSKKNLLISVNPSSSHIRFTNKEYIPSNSILSIYLTKHLQGGIINNISQYNNDRLVIIDYSHADELGYLKDYKLYLELMGKNSNLIITDSDDIVLEAVKKSYITDSHLVKTGLKYTPLISDKINPFSINNNDYIDPSNLEGLSKQAINEINNVGLDKFLNYPLKPTLYKGSKVIFYYTDLSTIESEKIYFDSLSDLLEYYYDVIIKSTNDSLDLLNTKKYIEKEIEKLQNKLEKQEIELTKAKDVSSLENKAYLLMSNLYLVKPYMTNLKVLDYMNDNKEVVIELNPNLSANENLNAYFNKVKKYKRTVSILSDTISQTKKDIEYYTENLSYLDYSKASDLKEIMVELGLRKPAAKNNKPHISKYIDNNGNIYYFGKNNMQNNYITHTLADKSDLWFHVKNIPGSHVVLKGEINEDTIKLASNIAAFYSKANKSIHVCVDYTYVKWIKKVKGEKGSFVTYTHEKMYFSDPSIDYINSQAKLIN